MKLCGPCKWQILSLPVGGEKFFSSASHAILPAALALSCVVAIRYGFLALSTFTAAGLQHLAKSVMSPVPAIRGTTKFERKTL